jgi:hypothetical protein
MYCQNDKGRTTVINIWPLGHTEKHDLYSRDCWRGTCFDVSLCFIVQMYLKFDLAHLSLKVIRSLGKDIHISISWPHTAEP